MAILKYQIEVVNRSRREDSPDGRVIAYSWQYEEVTNPHREGRILTREEAIEAIREQGLVLVHQMGGRIYDHPDEPMWQKDLARWVNKKMLFEKISFEEFEPRKGFRCREYFK